MSYYNINNNNGKKQPEKIHPAERGLKTTLIGIFANFLLALTKGITGYIGHSQALIADAIESFSDVVSSTIIYSGLRIAKKPPDENHPYGHGKAEPLSAAVVSLALVGAAVSIVYQSIHEIINPDKTPAAFTLFVLIGVIAVKETLFRTVFKVGSTIESTAVKTDAWHHRSDAITSLAALLGVSIALIGGKGYEIADDIAALIASVIILYNAYNLLKPSIRDLMDSSPSKKIEDDIRRTAYQVDGVVGLDKCKIRKMGFEFYVDLDIIVNKKITVEEGHEIAHNVKDTLLDTYPRIANALIHIEPDDDERINRIMEE